MASELDPEVRDVLATLKEMGGPELNELPPERARGEMDALFADAGPVTDIGRVEERTIPGPAGDIPVRVYAPDGEGPHPVVAFFHGGGFVLGDLDSHDAPARLLATGSDALVVSVDYRLAPEHPFPAGLEDCYTATEWLAANAEELGGDPERLAAAGDSAGGNLAAAVALAARDRNGPDIDHQALVYPVTDMRRGPSDDYPSREENAEGYFLTADDMAYFDDHYTDSWAHAANKYVSPIVAASHANLPPATVVTCGFDPLRDEGIAYAEALAADDTPVEHLHFEGLIHGVGNMVQEPADVQGGRDLLEAVADDLRDALH